MREHGLPNYFGEQRFGMHGDNVARAQAWLAGREEPPRDQRLRRLLCSALQSEVYNRVLAADDTNAQAIESLDRLYESTGKWNELQYGKLAGPGMAPLQVPPEFWVWPGSPRDPRVGDPLVSFRYDQTIEFVNAIREQRDCAVTFHHGARTQAVMDAAVTSAQTGKWVDV